MVLVCIEWLVCALDDMVLVCVEWCKSVLNYVSLW